MSFVFQSKSIPTPFVLLKLYPFEKKTSTEFYKLSTQTNNEMVQESEQDTTKTTNTKQQIELIEPLKPFKLIYSTSTSHPTTYKTHVAKPSHSVHLKPNGFHPADILVYF